VLTLSKVQVKTTIIISVNLLLVKKAEPVNQLYLSETLFETDQWRLWLLVAY